MDALITDVDTTVSLARVTSLSEAISIAKQAESNNYRKRTDNDNHYQFKGIKKRKSNNFTKNPKVHFDLQCNYCKKKGHDEIKCWSKNPEFKPQKNKHKNFGKVAAISSRPSLPVKVNQHLTHALVDSGSTESIISKSLANYLNLSLKPVDKICNTVNGEPIHLNGRSRIEVTLSGLSPSLKVTLDVLVCDNIDVDLLLGIDSMEMLGINILSSSKKITLGEFSYSYNDVNVAAVNTKEEAAKMEKLLKKYSYLFDEQVGTASSYEYQLNFKTVPNPFHSKPFRIPVANIPDIKKEIDFMLKNDIIAVGTTQYTSNAFTVPKSDGGSRLVIDFSKTLNPFIARHSFPIPTIDDLLYRISSNKIFSSIDIRSGFFHLLLREQDQQYTGFVLPFGAYYFKKMPMGICSAPEAFQHFMHSILGHLDFILIYMDDILVISDNSEQHYQHLEIIFTILLKNNVFLKRSKCHFFQKEIKYLGFILTSNGLLLNPEKVKAIVELDVPTSKRKLRGYIGMVQFFRRFIPNLATIIAPLTAMTSKKVAFKWTTECSTAFEKSKQLLAQKCLLNYPNFELPFEIMTDASDFGIGAVVLQRNTDGNLCPLHFYSKKLSTTIIERSIVEKEALAIISVLDHLRPMLYGQQLIVHCDNLNVINLANTKTETLKRYLSRINEFNPDIQKIEGSKNTVADYLSRVHEKPENKGKVASLDSFPISLSHISSLQRLDPLLCRYIAALNNTATILSPKEQRTLQYLTLKTIDQSTLLLHKNRIYIPKTLTEELVGWIHLNYMHPGSNRAIETINKNFFWCSMSKDIKQYTKSCLTCAKHKINPRQYAKLTATDIQTKTKKFEIVALDLQGPFPVNESATGEEYKYLLTIIDIHSRWVELIPLSNQDSDTIATALHDEWFCRYPRPRMILSDQGPNLKAKPFADLLKSYGVQHHFTTTYMATANSIVERLHSTINQIIRCLGVNNWLNNLPGISFSLRASVHQSLGKSPSDIVYSMDMLLPQLNANQDVLPSTKDPSQRIDKDLARKNKGRIPYLYKSKDLVLLRKTDNLLHSKWDVQQDGPFEIVEVHKNNTLTINKHGILERVNVRRIIPWKRQSVTNS